jgi:putative ABC transport system ATP-binding protein
MLSPKLLCHQIRAVAAKNTGYARLVTSQGNTFGSLFLSRATKNAPKHSRILQSIRHSTEQVATRQCKAFYANTNLVVFNARPFSSTTITPETNLSTKVHGETRGSVAQSEAKGDRDTASFKTKDPVSPKSNENADELGCERSEEAALAAQLNLSARLPRDKIPVGTWASLKEVWRLIKVARRETKTMGLAFALILIGSSINLSIPYSIGKILDLATKPDGGIEQVFGIELSTFYAVLGGLVVVGAGAQFGRNVLLRIVGERVVARLRSQLFRRTYAQNAEFFDANKTGDLISRLSADTLIVGKAITYNLSEGIRSIISGAAGIGAMAYVNPQLTLLMAVIGPPVALGGWYYGQIIRNIGRKIQDNLGTLTKIAEERLGNVKTSQSFAGEIIEVSRYNHQVKKIFSLGVKESLYSSTYSGCVSFWTRTTAVANMI